MQSRLRGMFKYGKYIDPEVIELCDAINKFKGCRTFSSCCGHGTDIFGISCKAETTEDLLSTMSVINKCIQKYNGWSIIDRTNSVGQIFWGIIGPIGAFDEANSIAKTIEEFLMSEEGKKYAK